MIVKYDKVLRAFHKFDNDVIKNITLKVSGVNKLIDVPSSEVSGILLSLYSEGLLSSDSHIVLNERTFFITQNGNDVIRDGGYGQFKERINQKKQLENKILDSTVNSHRLNIIQFVVTSILAIGTIIGIIIQCESYNSQKNVNDLEILKLKKEIQNLENK